MKIRAIKLLESISIYVDKVHAKQLQYINVEADPVTWKGWEFNTTGQGVEIFPPWKGDCALVPWGRVAFIQMRPDDKKAAK